jgi:hypothetical protein
VVVPVHALRCVMRLKRERVNQITGKVNTSHLRDEEQGVCVAHIRCSRVWITSVLDGPELQFMEEEQRR